jgi:hypothetical protein
VAPDAGVAIDAGGGAGDASAPDARAAEDASAPDALREDAASPRVDAGVSVDAQTSGESADSGTADAASAPAPAPAPNITIVVESSCATTQGAGVESLLVVAALGLLRRRARR